jgi:pimeloyl-ACP methyl ester carboxylesterase
MVRRAGFALPLILLACSAPRDQGGEAAPRPVRRELASSGARVRWIEVGSGPDTWMLVHGWASDRRIFGAPEAWLAPHRRVLLVDLPGHGESDALIGPYTLPRLAELLREILDAAGAERATLIGHSAGVPAARELLRRHPERVRALVALDGPLRSLVPEKFSEDQVLELLRHPEFETHRALFEEQSVATVPEHARASALAMMRSTQRSALEGFIVATIDPAVWTEEPITAPVLAIHAPHPYWDEAYFAAAQRLALALELEVWEDCDHYSLLAEPQRVARRVEAFLARLPR